MNRLSELDLDGFRNWVEDLWGIRIHKACPQCRIQGSPERSLSRAVFQDPAGRSFLLEKFGIKRYGTRLRVARILDHLNRKGLARALAPLPSRTGPFLLFYDRHYYQITPFLASMAIERPQWLADRSMGAQMGDFLIEMAGASSGIRHDLSLPVFSIKDYIHQLFRDMAAHHPRFLDRYLPLGRFLEQGLFQVHDRLPLGFCHGDFHPLNLIWFDHRVKAVIDWEFAGIKPDCYDAANLVGCAGIEHPEGLAMPMVTTFLSRLREAGIISPACWQWFPEYVLALRFAWLSEWLRGGDEDMLDTEAAFMNILIRHMDELRDIWQCKK